MVEANTKRPIPYASIYFASEAVGVFSDENGHYCLPVAQKNTLDSVRVSSLGYFKTSLSLSAFVNRDTIFLQSSPIVLENVLVTRSKTKPTLQEIGYSKEKLVELVERGYCPNSSFKIATYIEHTLAGTWVIRKVKCRTIPKENPFVQSYRIRLRLYSHSSFTQQPNRDMLVKNHVVDISPSQKSADFELDEQIYVPEDGFWIGVECVGYITQNGEYKTIKDGEFGSFKLKNTKKFKIESSQRIAPMYLYKKTKPKTTVESRWNDRWKGISYEPNLTFCFGAVIEKVN